MRELSVDLFCSVDGFAFAEGYPPYFGYAGPGLDRWIETRVAAPHVQVLGRRTYQELWTIVGAAEDPSPEVGDGGSFGRMTELSKLVFSSTLDGPLKWANSTLITEDAIAAIPRLKQEPGDPLRVVGSMSLGCSLIRAGLVDRVSLVVFPLLVGKSGGQPIFATVEDHRLALTGTEVLDGRLVALDYRLEPAGA